MSVEEMAARSDADINYSDIPELDEKFWEKAKITAPQTKPNVSLRVSEDVVAFFKKQNPRGYTARMAAVLSAYVQAHQPK
ncbi:BrnA antitoxin family protein [Pseudogemmobacter sonorensis]|uniref:BrnA antitoxin family protein n=1 Tax=Pseudogemmobacter sonorensis TaxID=2989681 RepID=UPI00368F6773